MKGNLLYLDGKCLHSDALGEVAPCLPCTVIGLDGRLPCSKQSCIQVCQEQRAHHKGLQGIRIGAQGCRANPACHGQGLQGWHEACRPFSEASRQVINQLLAQNS